MAIKQGKYRPPTNDYNDVIHFETDSEMVIMGDGSKLEDKLKQMKNNDYGKYQQFDLLKDATFNNIDYANDNNIKFASAYSHTLNYTSGHGGGARSGAGINQKIGMKFKALRNLSTINLIVGEASRNANTTIYLFYKGIQTTVPYSGGSTVTINNGGQGFKAGEEIVVWATNTRYQWTYNYIPSVDFSKDEDKNIKVMGGMQNTSLQTTSVYVFMSITTSYKTATEASSIKNFNNIITDKNTDKFGNIDLEVSNITENNSVKVRVESNSVLVKEFSDIKNGRNILDCSDITQRNNLQVKIELHRDTTSVQSPIIKFPLLTSKTYNFETNPCWEIIKTVTLSSPQPNVNFQDLDLEDYSLIRIIITTAPNPPSSGTAQMILEFRFNNTGNYITAIDTMGSQGYTGMANLLINNHNLTSNSPSCGIVMRDSGRETQGGIESYFSFSNQMATPIKSIMFSTQTEGGRAYMCEGTRFILMGIKNKEIDKHE